MSVHGYHGGYDSDDDYYSPAEEGSPWVLEREIGKGGFGLVKLYINQVSLALFIGLKRSDIRSRGPPSTV